MNLGTRMPDGERRKPIDIEVCSSKVKVPRFIKFRHFILKISCGNKKSI
jgi:hypothetical protein